MQPGFTLANHGIENYWSGKMKSGNLDGSAIYPHLHNRYIAYVYPKYSDYNGWNFPQRTLGFNTGNAVIVYF